MAVLLLLWRTKKFGLWISCQLIHQTRCPSFMSVVCLVCIMTGVSLSALTQEHMTFCMRTTCSRSSKRGWYFVLLFWIIAVSSRYANSLGLAKQPVNDYFLDISQSIPLNIYYWKSELWSSNRLMWSVRQKIIIISQVWCISLTCSISLFAC